MSLDNIMPGGADDNREEPIDCPCCEDTENGQPDPKCPRCQGNGLYEPDIADYTPLEGDVL